MGGRMEGAGEGGAASKERHIFIIYDIRGLLYCQTELKLVLIIVLGLVVGWFKSLSLSLIPALSFTLVSNSDLI